MELSQFDGKRFAMVLEFGDRTQVFQGTAAYQSEPTVGNVLRIKLDDCREEDGNPEFMIHENSWRDEIVPDTEYGCDYAICVDARTASKLVTN